MHVVASVGVEGLDADDVQRDDQVDESLRQVLVEEIQRVLEVHDEVVAAELDSVMT